MAYKEFIRPTLDFLDKTNILTSETAHIWARELLHLSEASPTTLLILEKLFAHNGKRHIDQRLAVTVGGVMFENPLVIGAGWDKVGHTLKAWHQLGAAGVEFGAVLAIDQEGNPKKRQFTLAPGVALNRLGFNTPGMHVVARNLETYKNSNIPRGINLGINKEISPKEAPQMFAIVAKIMAPYADYLTINVSSPNTPGLRDLQDKKKLTDIVQAVKTGLQEIDKASLPIFIKISDLPLTNIDDVIEVVLANGLAGIVCINTTTNTNIKAKYGEHWKNQAGGLSGSDPDYRKLVLEKVAHVYKQAGDKIQVWGVGGINGPMPALETMTAGASGFQVVTGIREVGTALPGLITRGISNWMDKNGVKSIREIVGVNTSKY